ncbi:MAG: diflavin flavoprotein [Cyanobacteria bacterium P01_H01_bin.15]
MVATPTKPKVAPRLTLQTAEIGPATTVIRSLDWDRDRFDIEFGLQNGTTYNSYLIQAEKTALVDTSHAKFRQLYLDCLEGLVDPKTIDYLIISHTEPDHSGLVKEVLAMAPQAVVVGSKIALQFLDNLIHQPFERLQVKSGSTLDLGGDRILEFISAPNLHWPDTILTYDRQPGILYTCDVFGMHYCSDAIFDEHLADIAPDYRFYYECLMAPNARAVMMALKKMDQLDGEVLTVANGHGPLLRHNANELIGRYRKWSTNQTKGEKSAVVFYVSDYGYSDRLSQAIAKGVAKTDIAVEMFDLKSADPQEVHEVVTRSSGVVIGMPPITDDPVITKNLGTIVASAKDKQIVGLFESYGDDDEPIDTLQTQLRNVGLRNAFPPIRVKETPDENLYKLCEESGVDMGQTLARSRNIKQLKSIDSDLDKALGRISAGLYIITAQKGDLKSAMLASWVAQASFEPPGITIAVAKDRAIESLMQVDDTFVLNVLEEGNYYHLMKQFLRRFKPGADRFAGVETRTAENGSPILLDALAYIECKVVSRVDCSGHWIVYSNVLGGRVSNEDALTAVRRR